MNDEDEWDDMWRTGLQARLDTAFPKICRNCGRIFETAAQYFTETLDINEQDKGLKPFVDEDTAVIVEAFRNCPCGSTLMEMFESPNDNTPEEIARRKKEGELAKSTKVEVSFTANESPSGPKIVKESGHSETKIFAPPQNRSPEGIARGKRKDEFARSTKMRKPLARNASRTSAADLQKEVESGLSELDLLYVEEKWGREWYSGLRPKGESAFPKTCRNCGRVYKTPDDFFTETANIRSEDTGLRACDDEVDGVIIEAYRNCICGSTLMDNFSDRRDMSPAGRKRRERFGQMLDYLIRVGLNADTAYAELLKVAWGGESKILAKIKPPD